MKGKKKVKAQDIRQWRRYKVSTGCEQPLGSWVRFSFSRAISKKRRKRAVPIRGQIHHGTPNEIAGSMCFWHLNVVAEGPAIRLNYPSDKIKDFHLYTSIQRNSIVAHSSLALRLSASPFNLVHQPVLFFSYFYCAFYRLPSAYSRSYFFHSWLYIETLINIEI